MNAIFKTKDRLLITGSDKDEKILIKSFVESVKDKNIVINSLVDINGEETGLSIELVEKTVETDAEVSE